MKIRFLETREVKDGSGQVFKEGKTYDLPEPSARHWLNRGVAEPVQEDGEAEQGLIQPIDEGLNAAAIRKMHRAELDDLAKQRGIDLGDFNVPDSKDYLVQELGLTDEAE